MIINREIYLQNLDWFLQIKQVKIITGARRSGKSFLLNQIIEKIKDMGIDDSHIITLNMEQYVYWDLRNPNKCHEYINQKMKDDQKYFIFIDEVQLIDRWEDVVNSLRTLNTCLFITGSNSKLLSGELATLLSGRYIQFQLRTITFSEYYHSLIKTTPNIDLSKCFIHYLNIGSYPMVLESETTETRSKDAIEDIYKSSILKDVVDRYKIRDTVLLNNVVSFLFDNVGRLVSLRKIVSYLNTKGIKIQVPTLSLYLKALEEAFIIERVSRYDIRGKQLLSTIDKYYLADHALMYLGGGVRAHYYAQAYENIVFNELRARGYRVHVGIFGECEVDFIAEKDGNKIYIQVCHSIQSEDTLNRELRSLKQIDDNYHKYIVTMDALYTGNEKGIIFEYLPNFLLKKEW